MALWDQYHIDIILLQETKLTGTEEIVMNRTLSPKWTCFWNTKTPPQRHGFSPNRCNKSGAVAILI